MTSIDAEPHFARLDSLTGLRFFAAFAVLLRHTVPEIFPLPVLTELSAIGPVGVGFFFVLSGFILTWTWKPTTARSQFYLRRAVRILPLHVLTTIMAAALLIIANTPLWVSTILSLFLLQAWLTDKYRLGGNSPSWSLSVEAFFYLLFPLIVQPLARLTVRKSWAVIFSAGTLMIFWHMFYLVAGKLQLSFVSALSGYTNPLYRLGEFVIGVALASAMRRGWRPKFSMPAALAVALFGYCAIALMNAMIKYFAAFSLPLSVLDLLFLPVTVVLITSAVSSDLRGRMSPMRNPVIVRLGEWSFALYLIQSLVITGAVRLFAYGTISWESGLVAIGVIVISVGLSGAFFHWFEKPAEGWLRSKLAS